MPSRLGHLDVEDDQVGPVLLGERDRLLAVAGLADDVVALLGEHLGQVEPDQRLVLGDDDAVGAGCGHGLRRVVGREPGDLSGTVSAAPAGLAERQTRWSQTPLSERTCGFKSHTRHQLSVSVARLDTVPHIRSQNTVVSALAKSDDGMADADERETARRCGADDPSMASALPTTAAAARPGSPARRVSRLRRRPSRSTLPTPSCSAGTSATATSSCGRRGVYTLSIFNDVAYPGCERATARPHAASETGQPTLDTCQAWLRRGARSAGSTGRACSRSTGRVASTSGRSCWRTGRRRSWRRTPGRSCAGCCTPTDARVNNWATRRLAGERRRYDYPR